MSLKTHLSSKRRDIEDLISVNEAELFAAEKTAQRCREKEYELRSLLNSTTAVISLLPREILAEIFLAAQSQNSLLTSKRLPQEYTIARVCKEWREIAWSTPRLWCRPSILFRKDSYEVQKCLLEEWIQRSGSCPLELEFVIGRFSTWEPPQGAFDNIIQSCHRWKTLISPPFSSLVTTLEQGTAFEFPLLETLELPKHHTLETPSKKWNFRFPPKLKKLDIINSLLFSNLEVNWNTLTSLSVSIILGPNSANLKEGIPLLVLASTCKSLVNLTCELKTDIVGPNHLFPSNTRITFPSIHCFSLTATPSNTAWFMTATEMPALTQLSVWENDGNVESPEDPAWTFALVDWAKRSSFKLQYLKITTNNLMEDRHIADMIRRLSPSQRIKTFVLDTSYNPQFQLSDSFIKQLTIKRRNRTEQLPHLGIFSFSGFISFTASAMASMLKSRTRYASFLKGSVWEDEIGYDENGGERGDDDENAFTVEETAAEPCVDVFGDLLLPHSTVSPKTLSIDIDYPNREWLQDQNPNRLRGFYQAVEEFHKDGRSFIFYWDGYSIADSEDD